MNIYVPMTPAVLAAWDALQTSMAMHLSTCRGPIRVDEDTHASARHALRFVCSCGHRWAIVPEVTR